jgi:hypothetical protein
VDLGKFPIVSPKDYFLWPEEEKRGGTGINFNYPAMKNYSL